MLWFWLQNINDTIFWSSKPLNMIHGTLFVNCWPLNTLFLLFSGVLNFNCIWRIYLFALYTLNTPSTPCCLSVITENVPFIYDAMIWTLKHQLYHFSFFETSKYVRRYLVCCFFLCKYVISSVFRHFNL